jgi:hypothetical protein
MRGVTRKMSGGPISAISVILAVAAIGLTQGCTRSPSPPATSRSTGSEGCAPDRPAIAHSAGGVTVTPPPGKEPPVPCVTATGFHTGEISIVLTNAGTLLFQPAWTDTPIVSVGHQAGPPIPVIRSADRGASWDAPQTTPNDSDLWVDRATGRVFWMVFGLPHSPPPFPGGPRLDISDDDGKTWSPGGRPLVADHPQMFSGPPTEKLKHLMQGYPNVVYACMGHQPLRCEKSLDGGMTWGPEFDIPYPPELEAIQGPAHDCSALGMRGAVGLDGTVYVPYGPCNRPYLAISHDEGQSWQLVAVANTEFIGYGYPTLGMDEQENLYAAWVAASDRLPYLAISRDHGLHWGTPLKIGAPGVNEAAIPYLVAGARGHVAVTYYGSKNAPLPFPPACYERPPVPIEPAQATPSLSCPGYEKEKWDTYVTESWNVLETQPLFWSATLNDPGQPTWYGCSPSAIGVLRMGEQFPFKAGPGSTRGCSSKFNRVDYYGAAMAPDGTVWVGFPQECPLDRPVTDNPNCSGTLKGTDFDGLWGLVGRLVPPGQQVDARQKTSQIP